MKIAGFNVNSVRARLPLLEAWFHHRQNDLDILCMQELKVAEDLFPFDFFASYGYRCYVNAQKRYNGVGTCTKIEVKEVRKTFDNPLLDREKRLLYTRFEAFHLINVYAPHGDIKGTEKFAYKLAWFDAFRQWLQQNWDLEKEKIVLIGDFNITFDDRDVYDPELFQDAIGCTAEEREKLHALFEIGFYDAWRLKHPDRQQFTWWDYQGAKIWKNQGMRIDFVLITKPLIPYLADIEVDMWARRKNKIKPSDHAPVVVEFKF